MKYLLIPLVVIAAATCHHIAKTPSPSMGFYQLKLHLVDSLGDVEYFDLGQEPALEVDSAQHYFDSINEHYDEIWAIAKHAGLNDIKNITDRGKIMIFRQHQELQAIKLDTLPVRYTFVLNVKTSTGKQWHYEGRITPTGKVKIKTKKLIQPL
jgi:hypothetical protein